MYRSKGLEVFLMLYTKRGHTESVVYIAIMYTNSDSLLSLHAKGSDRYLRRCILDSLVKQYIAQMGNLYSSPLYMCSVHVLCFSLHSDVSEWRDIG